MKARKARPQGIAESWLAFVWGNRVAGGLSQGVSAMKQKICRSRPHGRLPKGEQTKKRRARGHPPYVYRTISKQKKLSGVTAFKKIDLKIKMLAFKLDNCSIFIVDKKQFLEKITPCAATESPAPSGHFVLVHKPKRG